MLHPQEVAEEVVVPLNHLEAVVEGVEEHRKKEGEEEVVVEVEHQTKEPEEAEGVQDEYLKGKAGKEEHEIVLEEGGGSKAVRLHEGFWVAIEGRLEVVVEVEHARDRDSGVLEALKLCVRLEKEEEQHELSVEGAVMWLPPLESLGAEGVVEGRVLHQVLHSMMREVYREQSQAEQTCPHQLWEVVL